MGVKQKITGLVAKKLFVDDADFKLAGALVNKGVLSREDAKKFFESYLINDYKNSGRLNMLAELAGYCGYDNSIASVSRFCEDHEVG